MRSLFVLLFLFHNSCLFSQTQDSLLITLGESTFDAKEVLTNRIIPWDLVWGDDSTLWFTEKTGGIYRLDTESSELHEVGVVDEVYVSPRENAGMHSMCFHPQWPDSSYLFVHYVYVPNYSKLVRFSIDRETKKMSSATCIIDSIPAERSHNGSRMIIDSTGNIMMSMGEAYQFQQAQDISKLGGKILRFTPWGSIPKDNPFPDSYTWSYGHRNPQGLVLAENGILYSSEHGPSTDDEINIIERGKNYGWPRVNGFCDIEREKSFCEENQVIEPIWAFTPTCAPSGLTYYSGEYFPELDNHLLQCFLKVKALCVLKLSENGRTVDDLVNYFENDYLRLRDVEVATDGSIYLSTSNREKTLPPVKPNDDKIIHITNLERTSRIPVFESIEVNGNTIRVKSNAKSEGKMRLTTFYGGVLKEVNVPIKNSVDLLYTFDEPNVYWLKFIQEGRIVTKMIRVEKDLIR